MIYQTTLLCLVVLIGHSACSRVETKVPVTLPPSTMVTYHQPIVQILTSKGLLTFEVEIAKTPAEREKGLMFRESLSIGKGMIFIFEEDKDQSFWMKDTLIPLDLVFFDKNWFVVGFIEEMKPLSTQSRSIGQPSRFVLEINAGLIKKEGIRIGDLGVFVNEKGK